MYFYIYKYIKWTVKTKASIFCWIVSAKAFSFGTGKARSVWTFLVLAKVARLSTIGFVQQGGVYKLFPVTVKSPSWPLALSAEIIAVKWTTPSLRVSYKKQLISFSLGETEPWMLWCHGFWRKENIQTHTTSRNNMLCLSSWGKGRCGGNHDLLLCLLLYSPNSIYKKEWNSQHFRSLPNKLLVPCLFVIIGQFLILL